jgi:hypothetical protein
MPLSRAVFVRQQRADTIQIVLDTWTAIIHSGTTDHTGLLTEVQENLKNLRGRGRHVSKRGKKL